MSWVKEALEALDQGKEAQIRPSGGSMHGRIESGQLVTLRSCTFEEIVPGDVIFIRWKGNYLLHLVLEIRGKEILIGNNVGKVNGWIGAEALIAKVVGVTD